MVCRKQFDPFLRSSNSTLEFGWALFCGSAISLNIPDLLNFVQSRKFGRLIFMSEKKKYYICIDKKIQVEVTEEVYRAYYQIERHERYLLEKDHSHGVVLYSNLDTEDTLGEEILPDLQSVCVEDLAISHMLSKKLRQCIKLLSKEDQQLIQAIFYDEMSEYQLARQMGIPQRTINNRKKKILAKLLNFLKN